MHRVLISVPFDLSTYSSYDFLEGRHASGAASVSRITEGASLPQTSGVKYAGPAAVHDYK